MGDFAVIFDNEALYRDMFSSDAATSHPAELLVRLKPVVLMVKALLLGECQNDGAGGPNTLAVSVKQGARVYVLWREVTASGIAACGGMGD